MERLPKDIQDIVRRELGLPEARVRAYLARLQHIAGQKPLLLAEAGTRHRSDIESALAMLDEAAETAPLLKQALWRASRSES